jgi:hypothetical protein
VKDRSSLLTKEIFRRYHMKYIQILTRAQVFAMKGYKAVKFDRNSASFKTLPVIPDIGIYEVTPGIKEIELLD